MNGDEPKTNAATCWVRMFHPGGVQVTIPLPADATMEPATAKALLQSVTNLFDAGWLAREPGMEEGEEKVMARMFARREIEHEGKVTPMVDCYEDRPGYVYKSQTVYLNSEADVANFEAATGLKLASIPVFDGQAAIQNDGSKAAAKYIKAAAKAVGLVRRTNPKHNPDTEEGKKKPKHLFVRWDGIAKPADAATGEQPAHAEPPAGVQPAVNAAGRCTLLKSISDLQKREMEAMIDNWSQANIDAAVKYFEPKAVNYTDMSEEAAFKMLAHYKQKAAKAKAAQDPVPF